MEVPSGTNLEILSKLPKFMSELVKANRDLKKQVVELSESTSQHDTLDLIHKVQNELSKLEQKTNDEACNLKDDISKLSNYDDSNVKELIEEASKRIDSLSNYDDSELRSSINDVNSKVSALENYDDSNVRGLIEGLSDNIKKHDLLIKRLDSIYRNSSEQFDVLSNEIRRKQSKLSEDIERVSIESKDLSESTYASLSEIESLINKTELRFIEKVESMEEPISKQVEILSGNQKNTDDCNMKLMEKFNSMCDRIEFLERSLGVK